MLMPWLEPIFKKRLQNAKREVLVKVVELLYSSGETGCGSSTPVLVVVKCSTGTEGHGWCWQKRVL